MIKKFLIDHLDKPVLPSTPVETYSFETHAPILASLDTYLQEDELAAPLT